MKEFVSDTMKKRISPVVLVDYLRRPYVSEYDMNFRVTFDSNIMAKPSKSLFLVTRVSIIAFQAILF